jgi:pimeloyl-ACP methyl ester carboxylesterase
MRQATMASGEHIMSTFEERAGGLRDGHNVLESHSNQLGPSRRDFALASLFAGASLWTSRPLLAMQNGDTEFVRRESAKNAALASFPTIKQIDAGLLNVGYAEVGAISDPVVLLLHGWPYDIHSYAEAAPLIAAEGYRVIVPYLRGYGTTQFRSANTFRNGQQSALALDTISLMDALKIDTAIIAGFDWGARTANIVAALWPERCRALISVSGYLIGDPRAGQVPLPPSAELQWWYQFYFATERGKLGYEKYRREFSRLIWQLASPKWSFREAEFEQSAAAFDNPDHVAIVVHNYRWRLGLADGEGTYARYEERLAAKPAINVPTITLEGDANGAPHPDPTAYASLFSGAYVHRLLRGGVGHNLPQERPQEFARAVVDSAHLR